MGTQLFAIVTDMSVRSFDEPAVGRALVRDVMREIRALEAVDARIVSSRSRFRGARRLSVEVALVVAASSGIEAFDLGAGVLRSSIHAAGGTSVGWERVVPSVTQIVGVGSATAPAPTGSSWNAVSHAAARRVGTMMMLPEFVPAVGAFIDLR